MATHMNSDKIDKLSVGGKIMIAQKKDKCTYLYLIDDHQYSVSNEEIKNDLEKHKPGNENGSTTEESQNNFRWTRPATRLLLEMYNKKKQEFRDPDKMKKELWHDISTVFNQKGYFVTGSILDRKMRNLKSFYKSIKTNKRRTDETKTSWEYFDIFEEIFGNKQNINSKETITSMPDTKLEYLEECSDIFASSNVQPNSIDSNNDFGLEQKFLGCSEECRVEASPPKHCMSTISNHVDTKLKGAKKTRGLYALRKQQLKIEENRVSALKSIATALVKSNELQEERNKLLELYIKSKILK